MASTRMNRRTFLLTTGAVAATVATAPRAAASTPAARIVVIGGGFGGATAAKYLRMWSPDLQVTLVERDREFVSCPLSNRVLAGMATLTDLTRGYGDLADRHGVRVVHDEAVHIDPERRSVRLASGTVLPYDRLILSPGVDLDYGALPGLQSADARRVVPAAWKAGLDTVALRRQIEAMRPGGTFVITVPLIPYRCPPGPYERACQVASYFKRHNPRAKVLILDANEKVASKEALFRRAWADLYPGMVEHVPASELVDVDVANLTAKLQFDEVRADVLNVVPPMKAAAIAARAGAVTANGRWCEIDFRTYESTVQPGIHLLGDAILAAPLMPKSGHMANQHAKVCAAAIIALVHGDSVEDVPVINNTCYSFVSETEVVHIASVHRYDPERRTMIVTPGSAGLSTGPSELEGRYAEAWARNIWSDMLG
jgi:sulfide dehydrogenase [flavocytochrome c] flavoprotein subunit